MDTDAQRVSDALSRLQPARLVVRTPEGYVDMSEMDYNQGEYAQCVSDATESLKLRPSMPAAWYNISLCNSQLGNWDAAVAAATEGLRIEPESDVVRENLAWTLRQQRQAAAVRR